MHHSIQFSHSTNGRRSALRRLATTTLAFGAVTLPAFGYNLTLVNIQPVDAPSIVDSPYDPTVETANVLMEPVQIDSWTGPAYVRGNLDFEVRNDEPDWLRLDELEVGWTGGGVTSLVVSGDELFALDPSLYQWELGDPDKRRTALAKGGFGVSGLILQRNIDEEQEGPFGINLDVAAYLPPGGSTSYVVAGTTKHYVGEPPVDPWDPYIVGQQAALMRYDASGNLLASRFFAADRLTHVVEVGDGHFLTLGETEVFAGEGMVDGVTVSRVVLYEQDIEGALLNTNRIQIDEDFGIEGTVEFAIAEGDCSLVVTKGLAVLDTDEGTRYMLAAGARCGGEERAVIAMLQSDGELDPEFGEDGILILAGPGGGPVAPIGLAARRGWGDDSYEAWLGAKTGASCFTTPVADCQFGLTRLTLGGHDAAFDWVETTFPESVNSHPLGLAVTAQGKPILAGYSVSEFGESYAALARFEITGGMDAGFGNNGLAQTRFGGRDSFINGIDVTSTGIFAAIRTNHPIGADIKLSFGAAFFAQNGDPGWYHDAIESDGRWQHDVLGENFNYGDYIETNVQGVPQAVAEDDQGALVVVGGAVSQLTPDSPGVGPVSMAIARYLPFGELHSRRWIAPGASTLIKVPEDRTLPGPGPVQVWIRLDFEGETSTDFEILRDVEVVTSNEVNSHDAPGGYLFPIPAYEIGFDEAVSVRAHPLRHHHRHSSSNRFAYDISAERWNGFFWDSRALGAPDWSVNENYLTFGLDVIAMADGFVTSCRRSAPDNPAGEIPGTPSNFVTIQHAFGPVNKTEQEYVSYLHLQQESLPDEICPLICPEDNPDCNPAVDGVDPDGRELPEPIRVEAREVIGRIGNSGNSSGPHLHIHLNTGAGGESGDPEQGTVPILFQNLLLGNPDDGAGGEIEPSEWYPIHNLSIPHEYLVLPSH